MQTPPLVLIHGYPFDRTLWNPVAALLSREIKIFAPDLPGFGLAPVLEGPPSLDRMAEAIAERLKQENLGRAVVAGMSMGGYVALAFAEKMSEWLAGLVLIDTQTAADTEEARNGRRALIEKIRKEGPAAAVDAAMPKMFASANANNPALKRVVIQSAEKAGVAGLCWALEAMALRPDRTAMLQSLKVPVLVLHGAEDKFVPAEKAGQLAKSIPGAKYVQIPGAGHVTPIESPKLMADELEAFVRSIPQPQRVDGN